MKIKASEISEILEFIDMKCPRDIGLEDGECFVFSGDEYTCLKCWKNATYFEEMEIDV